MTSESVQPVAAAANVTGPRIGAAVIDLVLFLVLLIVMSALFGETESDKSNFSVQLNGAPAIIYALIGFGYYFVLEALTGQTLGKKVAGVKVVAEQGEFSWGKSAIRTILRIVDFLPFLYLVGIIAVAVTKKHQRIGDMAAGTLVVRA